MEKPKTQGDVRKERFNQAAEAARAITLLALQEIDEVLGDDSWNKELEIIKAQLDIGVEFGNLTPEERDAAIDTYKEFRTRPLGRPITDSDTLAGPIGYTAEITSIYD